MGFKLDDHYEKDCFSYSEIAAHWECEITDILYLIYETHELRNAYKYKTPYLVSLSKCQNQSEIDILGMHFLPNTISGYCNSDRSNLIGRLIIFKDPKNSDYELFLPLFDSEFPREVSEEPAYLYEDLGNDIPVCGSNDSESLPAYISAKKFDGTWLLFAEFKHEEITSSYILKSKFDLITREERDKFESNQTNGVDNLSRAKSSKKGRSSYLQGLQRQGDLLAEKYPSWSSSENTVQNTGNLMDWIKAETSCTEREAEIYKKILAEIFPELKKR